MSELSNQQTTNTENLKAASGLHPFEEFILSASANDGFHNDEISAIILPLFEEVLTLHEEGKVAPLNGLKYLSIKDERLELEEIHAHYPQNNLSAIDKIAARAGRAFELTEELKQVDHVSDTVTHELTQLPVQADLSLPITHPVYLTGYKSYEQALGHHDALTDIYSLGMLLASVSFGLNFNDEDDLRQFAARRDSLLYLNSSLHPTIANLIFEMTDLYRHRRARDLNEIIQRLKNFREYNPERQYDLSAIHGFVKRDISSKQQWILQRLKSRLFDLTRRNRLLYFRPNLKFVNLTVASVPNVIKVNHIKPENILTWSESFEHRVNEGKNIPLSNYLKMEDNPYLPAYLDRIRVEAARDKKEYGFSQLRLVGCFLNWYNFKENQNERIQSPLILIPVQLVKKKGLKDQFVLEITDTVAEVNPVLLYVLKETYNLELPDKIDLNETSILKLYEELSKQIEVNKSGIQLELIDKPRVKLIHAQAKQIIAQYQRRLRNKGKHFQHHHNFDYSYQRENYQPLGLQIFKKYIEQRSTYLEWLVNDSIQTINAQYFNPPIASGERSIISLGNDSHNPFRWEFDLCSVVLGNFNYKKMSLVSDYNSIFEHHLSSKVFDDIFSDTPKSLEEKKESADFNEQFPVVAADPTQTDAIAFAKKEKSYIIQGPPGTGKSQTITNLVADFVARGKKVLFVCEKRAALDVVYHRLKQQGMDEFCCLIHDSQEDKKQFIRELKTTYEKYRKEEVDLLHFETGRAKVLEQLKNQFQFLHDYENALSIQNEHTGTSMRSLLHRLIELRDKHHPLDAAATEQLPTYKDWLTFGHTVKNLSATLKRISGNETWAAHPFSKIRPGVFREEQPVSFLQQHSNEMLRSLETIRQEISKFPLSEEITSDFERLSTLIRNAATLKPLVETGNVSLLDFKSPHYQSFRQSMNEIRFLQEKYNEQLTKTGNWLNKLNEQDIPAAKALVEKWEGRLFAFFSGEFRRLKKILNQSYDFSKHSIKPAFKQILGELEQEYEIFKQTREQERKARDLYKVDNLHATEILVNNIHQASPNSYFKFFLEKGESGEHLALQLSALDNEITRAKDLSRKLLNTKGDTDFKHLNELLQNLLKHLNQVSHILPHVRDLENSPEKFVHFISRYPLNPDALEATLAYGNLIREYQRNRQLEETDGQMLENALNKLKNTYKEWMQLNAKFIIAYHHHSFREKIVWAESSNAGVPVEEREQKRSYNEGRKILENEFNKQMRFKPIRELATGASGRVIKDLKPVWLMSPLSVSDALPVDGNFFDVVIFDEASQITLEEGIPPVFRAKQSIIVGDEMQMPPTNFFNTTTQDPDDIFDDESENNTVTLDADSLLVQASRKLPSVMLGWHYRSRYESLISFSNHAFYHAGLLTIPDKSVPQNSLNEMIVEKPEQAAENISCLFDRSISFHFQKNGLYETRTNHPEAQYIAHLVLNLLRQKTKESIGIVAFSMEQQMEIESALESLAADWKMTAELEEAYQRTEDDQFVGLFIKNLENIQGDERDIIIMSICYGYDSNQRMLMNFGPINRKGGEKRLNVIFSRAKKHIAVISSIKFTDIKNEYNEGANFFRRYLQYAELVSTGSNDDAMSVLKTLSASHQQADNSKINFVSQEIAGWLSENGFIVKQDVGQSKFKCHLGIKKSLNELHFNLGILIDAHDAEDSTPVIEKYFQRPMMMEAFGWKVLQVWTNDWFHNHDSIKENILEQLR